MSVRPYFNASTEELETLFEQAVTQRDLAALDRLAQELEHRAKPRATYLKQKVHAFQATSEQRQEACSIEEQPTIGASVSSVPLIQPSATHADGSIAHTGTAMNIIERLSGLLNYVIQTAKLKGTPVRAVERHGIFKAYENELLGLPGIEFNIGANEDDVWLRVARLHETAPPIPKTQLLVALIAQSKNPANLPALVSVIDRAKLESLGIESPEPITEEERSLPIRLETLSIAEQVDSELRIYIENFWQPWANQEKEVRKSIGFYSSLFALNQMLQGNLVDSPLELVMGVGVAIWELPDGKVYYPLLTKLVELAVDERTHAIDLRPRSLDPRVELEIYAALDNPGVANVARAGKDHFSRLEESLSPFVPSTYEPLLRSAASLLDAKGVYWPAQTTADDRQLPKASQNLQVTDTWVLFARPRSSSLFIQDIERFEKLLESGIDLTSLSSATLALVSDPSNRVDEPEPTNYRGLSNIDRHAGTSDKANDLFFPLPYNDEQVQIVQMLDHHDGVVVQGPPGTGKTHTIANVISHYLALGKRVLVTSMKDPALSVLQEKLPEDIRPLAISLLSSEADGMKQFEHAIRKISAEVGRIDKPQMRREVVQLDQRIDQLHAQIAKIEYEISAWAKKNLQPISLDGQVYLPVEVAREIADHPHEAGWIPDVLTIAPEYTPTFDSGDVVALRAARAALGADLDLLGQTLPAIDAFPAVTKLQQVHTDLSRLAELNEQVSTSAVPALRDMEQATIEDAIEAHSRVVALKHTRQSLHGMNFDWLEGLERRIRQSSGNDDLLKLLNSLKAEVQGLLGERKQFIARPVSVPQGVSDDLMQAIYNLSQSKSAFGLVGVFGKSAEKKAIEGVKVLAGPPKSKEDWRHVLEFVRFTRKCEAMVVRWNALAEELQLPLLASAHEFASKLPMYLDAFETLDRCVREEQALVALLKPLLPSWAEVSGTSYTVSQLARVEGILDHNLTRNRLASTWHVKESFLRALDGCNGPIVEGVTGFLHHFLGNAALSETELHAQWSELMAELRRQHGQSPHLRVVIEVTEKLESSGANQWARLLRCQPLASSHDDLLPDNWKDLWRWRRLLTLVETMDGRSQLGRLSQQRSDLEADLSKVYQKAVTARTWLKMAEKATPAVKSALEAYRVAISRIGRGTGVRAPRFRKDARVAAEKASPAIPCWIMPHYRVSESLPVAFGEFDLVIIDEASQSDLTALTAILRAKKILVVGDDQQVSPEGVGLEEDKIRGLMNQYLDKQVDLYRPQMSPDKSIYDLFKVVFAKGQVMLREHFRCVGPIIEYSKREFYNHELRPLRMPRASERLDPPLIDVHVIDGSRGNGKTNQGEAIFILEEVRKITADPKMAKRSIGVVSLVGSEQAKLVWDKVSQELGEEVIEKHQMAFGDARTFQGKERDIMFLSMVVSGRAQASSQEMFRQRYNVAASRARDRMYLVRSITVEELSQTDKLRLGLIQHFQAPYLQNEENVSDLRTLCESDFEREVFDLLVERGYRVQPQVKVGSYRIDLVVEGENDARLAIECDGDQYHGPDQWEHDMMRQRVLERAGWRFWRCFASTFVSHRTALVEDLMATLKRDGIEPTSMDGSLHSIHSQSVRFEAFPVPLSEVEESVAIASS
ncbi:AAA domain-containing protein [Luteimonas sp. MC1828]|uniref:AAA domain-containing protein n=1 Tax=Luteimonas sp. MC1828 TaxID=2799787 RepID=UPI0018F1243F|nr:AAA domain-containing protein [Luteimonas sp. MC1828]MBJ7575414.1 AAA family ATPase [Luteimonas sp. MC1828]